MLDDQRAQQVVVGARPEVRRAGRGRRGALRGGGGGGRGGGGARAALLALWAARVAGGTLMCG